MKQTSKLKMNKKIILAVATAVVLIVALGAVILTACLSNNFRMGKISKVELGMKMTDVEKILGAPSEESEDGEVLYWYQGKAERKLTRAEKALEKAFKSDNEQSIERQLEKYDKLMSELEEMTFKSIAVSFDFDGRVCEVFYDKQSKYHTEPEPKEKEIKESVLKLSAVTGSFITVDGESEFIIDTEESEIPYTVRYKDGCYYLGTVSAYDIDLSKEDGRYYALWQDAFGEYSAVKLDRLKYEYVIENDALAFYKTTEEEITIPNGVVVIAQNAIKSSETLKSIVVPSSVESIGEYAFEGASKLESVTIDNDIVEIKENAFAGNPQLKTVYFNGNKQEYILLNVKNGNENLKAASVVYNCDPGTHTDGEVKNENYVAVSCVDNASYDKVTYCADCKKEIKKETVVTEPAKGHTAAQAVKENQTGASNCKESGTYEKVVYCLTCDKELNRETVSIVGAHNYENHYCTVCGQQKPLYTRDGDYIYFGEYPQTIKDSSVTITTTTNERGYYLGSDGEWYAKVTATPCESSYKFSTGTTVTSGTVYYFKVEPIRWRILSTDGSTALILCDSIIENHRYDDSSNNYAKSEIRKWLNETFYETAFGELQREIIITTTVDNSVASTGNQYACEDTQDNVFLLSYKEVRNSSYGFSSSSSTYDTARRMLTSDYSRATGAYMNTSSTYYGNGYWWLRSPNGSLSILARGVYYDGCVNGLSVDYTLSGVVPALQIRL